MKLRSALGRSMARLLALALLSASIAGMTAVGVAAAKPSQAVAGCQLSNGPVKHVIYLVFDNTHFMRDNPNVPSDLEQMPHLLNFLTSNGTLLTNWQAATVKAPNQNVCCTASAPRADSSER